MHFCILAWLAIFDFPALAPSPIQSKTTVDILNVILGKNVPALVQGQGLAQLREIQSDHVIREGAGVAGPSPLFHVHDPDPSRRQDPAVEKDDDGLARPVECRRTIEIVGRLTDAVGPHPREDGLRPDEGHPPDEGKWFLFLQNLFVIVIFFSVVKVIFVIPMGLFSVSPRSNALISMYPRMGGELFGFGSDFGGICSSSGQRNIALDQRCFSPFHFILTYGPVRQAR